MVLWGHHNFTKFLFYNVTPCYGIKLFIRCLSKWINYLLIHYSFHYSCYLCFGANIYIYIYIFLQANKGNQRFDKEGDCCIGWQHRKPRTKTVGLQGQETSLKNTRELLQLMIWKDFFPFCINFLVQSSIIKRSWKTTGR